MKTKTCLLWIMKGQYDFAQRVTQNLGFGEERFYVWILWNECNFNYKVCVLSKKVQFQSSLQMNEKGMFGQEPFMSNAASAKNWNVNLDDALLSLSLVAAEWLVATVCLELESQQMV